MWCRTNLKSWISSSAQIARASLPRLPISFYNIFDVLWVSYPVLLNIFQTTEVFQQKVSPRYSLWHLQYHYELRLVKYSSTSKYWSGFIIPSSKILHPWPFSIIFRFHNICIYLSTFPHFAHRTYQNFVSSLNAHRPLTYIISNHVLMYLHSCQFRKDPLNDPDTQGKKNDTFVTQIFRSLPVPL